MVGASPADLLAELAAVERFAPVAGYIVQALLAGGTFAAAFLDSLVRDAEGYLQEAVAAGTIRPSRDPAARAALPGRARHGRAAAVPAPLPAGRTATSPPPLRHYADAATLPALELYTEGLLTDRGLLDAYLADRGEPPAPSRGAAMSAPAVEVRGLTKTFGSARALDGLDLTVADRGGARLPRPERRRQVHDDPRAARPAAGRRRRASGCSAATRGATPSRCTAGWPTCPATSTLWPDADRRRGDRPARPAARRPRPRAPGGAARALRARPDQEGRAPTPRATGRRSRWSRRWPPTPSCCCSTSRRPGSTR